MTCPECGAPMRVCNSINKGNGVRYKRHLCQSCGARATSWEIPETTLKDMERQLKEYQKLRESCKLMIKKWEKYKKLVEDTR